MPQLSITDLADGVGSLADKINALIAAIKAAYNKLDDTNFNTSSNVPREALMRPKAFALMNVKQDTVLAGAVIGDIFDVITVPTDCDLAGVKCVAHVVSGGTVEVDVYVTRGLPAAPTMERSVLAAPISLPTGTNVKGTGTIAWTSLLEDDVLSLRAVTGVGEQIDVLNMCLLVKALHTS
uniref:Uncharacterized protein n=1 Tax=viral metagenome TaxID=1070528 RepID=A0A6M3XQE7_9ZZZZ